MEDGDQALNPFRAQVFEVDVRDHRAGNVAGALEAEDFVFKIDQAAAIETEFPQAARAVQQIQMRQAREGRSGTIQAIARFQERLIKCRSVEGDQHLKFLEMTRERVEQ